MRPMPGPHGTANLATRLGVVAVLVASVAACAGVPDVLQGLDGSANAQQLNASWQPQPMRPSAAIVAEADRACREDIAFQPSLPLLLVDARGEGRLQLFYGDPNGGSGECDGIFVGPDGSVRAGGPGGSSTSEAWQPNASDELVVMTRGASSGTLGEDEEHVAGRAGPEVARVQVIVDGIASPIEATVGNGWWAAWWPGGVACTEVVAIGADGAELGSNAGC